MDTVMCYYDREGYRTQECIAGLCPCKAMRAQRHSVGCACGTCDGSGDDKGGTVIYSLASAQQARCPVHGTAVVSGKAGLLYCGEPGCEWNRKQGMAMQNAPVAYSPGDLLNAARPLEPVSYFEADRNYYRDKWRRTQGIRGALRNLWRQLWK